MAFRLSGEHEGEPVRLLVHEGRHILGTADDADLRIQRPTISRRHAEIHASSGHLHVRDLGSSNGTRIDDRRVTDAVEVQPGQRIRFGEVALTVERVSAGDEQIGAELSVSRQSRSDAAADVTLAPVTLDRLAFDHLPRLLALIGRGISRTEFARHLGESLWQALSLSRLVLGDADSDAIMFEAGDATADTASGDVAGLWLEFAFSDAVDPRHEQRLIALAHELLNLAGDGVAAVRTGAERYGELPDPPPLDPDVRQIYRRAERAARSDIPVLIRGESGTGKELLARFLHDNAGPIGRPFIAVNCAALASDLLEAELFGIDKGVATGVDARPGCFELAHGGTLFLDEIGDMPASTQAKILRVVQEGEIVRVGGSKRIPAQPRLVSATNRNLEKLLGDGEFRLDLLHRIAGWEVTLPPLRERPADLPNLALHFLARFCGEQGVAVRGISRKALEQMADYRWPGNVRELQQEMHRVSVFLGDGDVLSSEDLAPTIRSAAGQTQQHDTLEDRLAGFERVQIKQALARCDGKVSRAAESLGIARSTMYRRMSQLGMHAAENAAGEAAE